MNVTFLHYWRATFWPTLESTLAPVTRSQYGRFLRKFLDFAGEDILLADVTEEHIEEFGAKLADEGASTP